MNTLKNIIGIIAFLLIGFVAMAQNTTIQFVGKDRTGNDYVRLNHVSVFDEDQLWHEMLYYPDTTLFLGPVSVEDYAMQDFRLMQNVPNPFEGITDIALSLPDVRDVTLEIYDMLGKVLVKQSFPSLQEGTHLFRASMTSPQTYLLSATTKDGKTSIKMVNEGVAATNSIEYIGMTNPQGGLSLFLNESKGAGSYPFNIGDKMKYTGYALIDDEMRSSEVVKKKQYNNETIQLKFDVERPVVETKSCYSLSAEAACLNAEVTSDNNASVTERGFCYTTQNTHTPTLNDSWISVGTGVGLYTTNVTDLTAGTVYYVRAYAINAIGVSYGSIKSIRTHDTIPEVTTTVPSQITINSFVSGGNVLTDNGAAVTVRGVCWSTAPNPTTADNHTVDGSGLGTFTSSILGLECGTTYYVRAYATNSVGTAYGDTYSVTTLSTGIPEITSNNVSEVTSNSAVCGGVVTHDGCDTVTARGVCWSTSQYPTVSNNHTTNGGGMGSFTSSITGLTAGTTYYVRAYATNSVGTSYGNQRVFTTLAAPTVTTNTVSGITSTSATCGGYVTFNGGATVTARGVCWSTSQNPTVSDSHTTNGSGTGSFTSSITGLTAGTTYYVRAYATNSVETSYGEQRVFTTLAVAPTLTTNTVSNITSTSATCGGNVTNDGGATVTARGVCWSTSQNPTVSNSHTSNGSGTGSYTSSITGLTAGTTYYVRAYATNSVGTSYGEQRVFTTLAVAPTLTTNTVSNITSTSATCGGNVTSTGGASVTARGVCWSTSQNPTVSDSHTTNGSGTGSFTSSITGLTAGTTYYVRAYATNSAGTSYGAQRSFTTLAVVPTLTTNTLSNISSTSATCGGNVTSDGGATVTARGVCWSTSQNPTVSDSHTTNGSGTGSFTSSITGLTAGTTYYVRAYATNSVGTSYGAQRSFTTLVVAPTLTTNTVSNITSTSATCGGNVTSDGGATVTARGVCWSTSQNPTVSDSHTTNGNGTGSFTSSITGLTAVTTYYVRAYATNSAGTGYGSQRSFTTTVVLDGDPCPGAATVTDYDNNTYNTVKIGNQCWMKENLRTTHYANGTSISLGSTYSLTKAYRYYPNNSSSNVSTYGYLYNWKAVMGSSSSSTANPSGVQGICPTGWHVPSYAEWTQLTDYVRSQSQYQCGSSSSNIAKALASTTGWSSSTTTCAVGNNPSTNNATGFSALSAGYYDGDYTNLNSTSLGTCVQFGNGALFWSASSASGYTAYKRGVFYNSVDVGWTDSPKLHGFSVRCVKDVENTATAPVVTTISVTSITANSAICGGNVTSDGGATVTARGVCWSTSQNPTVSNSHTTDGSGTGSFTSSITGLTAGTTYYVRAYATNSVGTAYGSQVSFTTTSSSGADGQPCPGAATVTDYDNNTYNTVKIGDQCWMKENLRTTHYANGTTIPLDTNISRIMSYRYYPNNDANNVPTFGYLYNWRAVMRGQSYDEFNPVVQGICPTGWHVPNYAEWNQLTNYLSAQTQYRCNSISGYIAKALASNTGWITSSNTCAVGNNLSTNNATGFSALPAGIVESSNGIVGCYEAALFWSASGDYIYDVYNYQLVFNSANIILGGGIDADYGLSVRCIKGAGDNTSTVPTVTTNLVTSITTNSATCEGVVISDGGEPVTVRGVCWSTSQNPTVSDSHTTNGNGINSFTSSITGLTAGTTYYVRAYATNSQGTAYGNELSFTTMNLGQLCPGAATVTDIDGNTYNTVKIGEQCWMKENLRTTHYANGTSIALGSTTSTTTAYRYYPEKNSSNVSTYGYLYNWKAVMGSSSSSSANPSGVQGICPTGWHVPSSAEWTQLTNYVGSQTQYQCNNISDNIAKALASTTGWNIVGNTCAVSNNPGTNNATGFSALPAGGSNGGSYLNFGEYAYFWSATENNNYHTQVYNCYLYFNGAEVYRLSYYKDYGFSVRCVKDVGGNTATVPTVTTTSVTSITANSATCGGNVTSDGGATVTARGVCWSTSQNPTVNDSHTTNGSGTGSFTSSITGLTAGTTYYVRAYATNSVGTAYGSQVSFTTTSSSGADGQPCPGAATVTDYDNNTYNTVKIGNQCWMKENLCTTHYSNGTSIALGSDTSTTTAYRYNPNNDANNVPTYGYLYNWVAVMHGASSSSANPSGVQGICPMGWHVPSDAEWTQLTDYVSSQTQYQCNNNSSNIAKALASTTGWNSSTTTCAVGNNPSSNNATGFSALPAGTYRGSYSFGVCTFFWSATENSVINAYYRYLGNGYSNVSRGTYNKNSGNSVRCVRDDGSVADGDPCPGAATVTDYDNNTYNTVKIGNQCWMKENLRTTHYSNGTSIALGSSTSTTTAYRYYPNNSSSNVSTYGYLYNWKAVMGNNSSSSANPSGVQGICPTGWHVPSDAEWTQLTDYVSSQSQYQCNNSSTNNAKALASTTGWSSSTTTCAVGNNPSSNNATGFSALPAGYYNNGGYGGFGGYAYFWSATENNDANAYYRYLGYNNVDVGRYGYYKYDVFSVRCLRD